MSNLWVVAVKPNSTGKLPVEDGLYWRLHPKGRVFSRADASSEPFNTPDYLHVDDDPDADQDEIQHAREYFAPRKGYSAYTSPHHVHQYAEERGLASHMADVVAFHGKQIGYGHDGEPLVMPYHDKPFLRVPYEHFEKRLRHTRKPGEPLDLDSEDGSDWFGGGDGW